MGAPEGQQALGIAKSLFSVPETVALARYLVLAVAEDRANLNDVFERGRGNAQMEKVIITSGLINVR